MEKMQKILDFLFLIYYNNFEIRERKRMYSRYYRREIDSRLDEYKKIAELADKAGYRVSLTFGNCNEPSTWDTTLGPNMSWAFGNLDNDTQLAIVDSPKVVSLLSALNLLKFEGHYSVCCICAEAVEKIPGIAKAIKTLSGKKYGVKIVLDSRTEDIPARIIHMTKPYPHDKIIYTGELPEELVLPYAKSLFLETTRLAWSGSFIVGRGSQRLSARLNGIAKSKVLANALLMGRGEVYVPTGTGTGRQLSGGRRDILMDACQINTATLTGRGKEAVESVQRFRDTILLWRYCADLWDVAIRLDEEDLANPEQVNARIKQLGEWIGVASFLETYDAGVPIEDIIG